MEHQRAIEAQLPERYAFGELSGNERDNFEEHLADCTACMEGVDVALTFASNAHAVLRDQASAAAKASTAPAGWFAWPWGRRVLAFSGAFNLALAGLVLYGILGPLASYESRLRILESPRVSEEFPVPGAVRGAARVFPVKQNSSPDFRLDVPPGLAFEAYQCSVKSVASGTQKAYNLHVTGPAETLNLAVPVAGLAPGDYEIRLSGSQGARSTLLANFVMRVTPDN